jgi:putative flippase GtrA
MQRLGVLVAHPLTRSGLRYGIAGAIVAGVYLLIPLALNGGAGIPIEACIPVAYVTAVTLHFNLQRHFVFRHVDKFALSRREQIIRYIAVGLVQYPAVAVATAILPHLLHTSQRLVFVGVTVTMSLCLFLVLRTRIFHASDVAGVVPECTHSGAELKILEQQLLRRGVRPREGQGDSVQPEVQ